MEQLLNKLGLCATCRYRHMVKSAKGSFFVMCNLSKADNKFQRYPPLPLLKCDGYRQVELDRSVADES
jgi:hypothetical protein